MPIDIGIPYGVNESGQTPNQISKIKDKNSLDTPLSKGKQQECFFSLLIKREAEKD